MPKICPPMSPPVSCCLPPKHILFLIKKIRNPRHSSNCAMTFTPLEDDNMADIVPDAGNCTEIGLLFRGGNMLEGGNIYLRNNTE